MKLIVGMIVKNEAPMLALTHERILSANRIALDTGSTDGTVNLLRNSGFQVGHLEWRNEYDTARNDLLNFARFYGKDGDWLLQLDADEVLVDWGFLLTECANTKEDVISFPRKNIAKGDSGLWEEYGSWPDLQSRCIRLGSKAMFVGNVHERVFNKEKVGYDVGLTSKSTIYHYGWCKTPGECLLRNHNYVAIKKGEPVLTEVPEWAKNMSRDMFIKNLQGRHALQPFTGYHPLVGI